MHESRHIRPHVGYVQPSFYAARVHTSRIFKGEIEAEPFELGCREACGLCGAYLFPNERKKVKNPRDGNLYYVGKGFMCCRQNRIRLPLWVMPTQDSPAYEILKLWEEESDLGSVLRDYSRQVIIHRASP